MRSAKFPEGLPFLKPGPKLKVKMGNAMAEASIRFAEAQERVKHHWCWEQPKTSIMWVYKPVREFMTKYAVVLESTDVCAYRAPWTKPPR